MSYTIGWLSSGRDQAARDLLLIADKNMRSGLIPAKIEYVFCNCDEGENEESDRFLNLARDLRISTVTLSSRQFSPQLKRESLSEWRHHYHEAVIEKIKGFSSQAIILAGYMLIVSPSMCRKYTMINLHPAAPGGPAGTWQEVIWQLLSNKAEQTGITMHLVTEGLDEGPPVAYCTFPIRGGKFDPLWDDLAEKLKARNIPGIMKKEGENNPLFRLIREEGVRRELPLIVLTLKALAEGRVQVHRGKKFTPYCLNDDIEKYLGECKMDKEQPWLS